jgi:hypothetical protein
MARGGTSMLEFVVGMLSMPESWRLVFGKVGGALPYAAFAGVIWNFVRRGTVVGLFARVMCSMAIIVMGWWALLFTFFGFFFAAYY